MFSRAPAAGPGFGTPPVGVSSLVANTKFFTTLVSTPDSRPGQGPQTVAVRAFGQTASSAPRKPINMPYAEYPQDAIERRISGTVVVDIVVNRAGEVSTAAVVGGPQELRSSAFKAALGLKFEAGSATTALRVGIEYRLTADSWGVRVSVFDAGTPSPDGQMRQAIETLPRTTPLEGVRIGVAVMPPKKIRDVPPIYPSAAQEARVQGVVILEARIDESGNVGDTRILRSIPLLDQAATNAVRQWQYTPTLLNGAAVPVVMTVTVNFTLRTQVHLRVTMPDGTLTLLRTSPNGGIARTEYAPMSKYGFAPFVDSNRSVDTVTVVIYELGDPGTAPTSLGTIELKPGAGPVQTNTTPSFGIEVMSVER
jgi:protein TonB